MKLILFNKNFAEFNQKVIINHNYPGNQNKDYLENYFIAFMFFQAFWIVISCFYLVIIINVKSLKMHLNVLNDNWEKKGIIYQIHNVRIVNHDRIAVINDERFIRFSRDSLQVFFSFLKTVLPITPEDYFCMRRYTKLSYPVKFIVFHELISLSDCILKTRVNNCLALEIH